MQDTETLPASAPSSAKLTSDQIEKIADENGEVYRRDIWKTTWKTRTQGLWAGGALGIFFGGGIGALTVFSTLIVGVPFAAMAAMLLPVVSAFAIAGMVTGIGAFTIVGPTVGAVVGGKKMEDRKKLLRNPTEELQDELTYHGTLQPKETFWNRIIPFTKGSNKIVNWRNALIFAALGVGVAALLLSVAPVLGGGFGILTTISGFVGTTIGSPILAAKAITCMTYVTGALFGAFFGTDFPTIAANTVEFVADIFGGRAFQPNKSRTPELMKAASACPPAIPRSALVKDPVALRSGNITTNMSQLGSYAGKQPAEHLRRVAEQNFKNLNVQEATRN